MLRKRDGTMGVHDSRQLCIRNRYSTTSRTSSAPFRIDSLSFVAGIYRSVSPIHQTEATRKEGWRTKETRTKQKICDPILSRHGRPATCSIHNMVVGLVCVADDGGLFSHVTSLGRSLLVGWVGSGREQQTKYQAIFWATFLACIQQTW